MHIVQEKHSIAQAGQRLLHRLFIELLSAACGGAFQSLQYPRLVSFGLQPSDEPGAGIR